jgi:methenyltetrahydromethanopterin cyclohydrolase
MTLNEAAYERARPLVDRPGGLGTAAHRRGAATVIDCGVEAAGSEQAGIVMAEVALGGLGRVELRPAGHAVAAWDGSWPDQPWPAVVVHTAAPIAACLASQYAGWKIDHAGFFAMASGPVRAAIGREPLYDAIGLRERTTQAVGVLECGSLPPAEACERLAVAAGVEPQRLLLLVARTASAAGGLQIVARSVETALHKLHDLGFELSRVVGGRGAAPLPPIADRDLTAIGRTNDAILYGGRVVLEVTGDDESLRTIGPRCVSAGSASYGEPFLAAFDRAGRDFYAIDPALFAPAELEFVNVDTGLTQRFGGVAPAIVAHSFTSGASR